MDPSSTNLVDEKDCSDEELQNLTWSEKSRFIQSDPVTCARHFDHSLQSFMTNFILSDLLSEMLLIGSVIEIFHDDDSNFQALFYQDVEMQRVFVNNKAAGKNKVFMTDKDLHERCIQIRITKCNAVGLSVPCLRSAGSFSPCTQRLFVERVMSRLNDALDDGIFIPINKDNILEELGPEKDLRSYQPLDNLAMIGSRAYSKVVQVFHMYEQREIKDQKPVKGKIIDNKLFH
ncbi:unnamed protein product [Mytilus coruscus]|uniref:Uncharacterized protein n=1 Tax=Mytilus coruscus TaxID=42192 RepID=A0A6J8BLV0_MYTCO|nr:unnamed protein product [Mytilus coruscus]